MFDASVRVASHHATVKLTCYDGEAAQRQTDAHAGAGVDDGDVGPIVDGHRSRGNIQE